jgi:DNA-binding transcriptional ArsR family regulator
MTKDPTGPGYDPTRDVVLDARTLRGVAHPLRLRLLGSLRNDGPQTATQLAARLGESSAATSYHLRTLASHGFVTEAPELGHGRERFWRAVHRSTWFGTPPKGAPERELGEVYLRTVARIYAENLQRWVDESGDWPQEWVDVATLSDQQLRLSAAEAERLQFELMEVLSRYRDEADRREVAGEADGVQRIVMATQVQLFPRHGQLDAVLPATEPSGDEPGPLDEGLA